MNTALDLFPDTRPEALVQQLRLLPDYFTRLNFEPSAGADATEPPPAA